MSSPAASVNAWPASASRARLPDTSPPTICRTTTPDVSARTASRRPRCAAPPTGAWLWLCPAPMSGAPAVDRERDLEQVAQGVGQVAVHELVAHLTALGRPHDEAAAAQAREMVGDVGAGEAEVLGQPRRVRRAGEQRQQDAGPRRVGQ